MGTRMLQRRGTSAEWSAANPVLGDGEIGYEKATGRIKVGDGVTPWNSLPASTLPISLVDAAGDLLVGSANDTVVKLAKGANGQVLTVDATGAVVWANTYTLVDAAGDLIVGSADNVAARLAKGTDGQYLSVVAGVVTWITPPATDLSSRVAKAGDTMSGRLQVTDLGVVTGTVLNVRQAGTATKADLDAAAVFDTGNRVYSLSNPPPSSGVLVSVTTTYSVAAGIAYVLANGTFTVTIPAASAITGRVIDIKNIGTGVITIATSGGTIDGSATISLDTQYNSVTVVSNGTNWFII